MKEREAIRKKKELVNVLLNKAKEYPNLALLNLKNLPDSLLQSLKKKLREEDGTYIKVAKLAVIKRVLEQLGLKNEAEKINQPCALILTKKSPYELFRFLKTNKKKIAAKPGQIALSDIVVPAGETDLPPGPALSELKAAGINVQIKGGKIAVVKDSVVTKAGEAITEQKAKALQTLGIMPFEIYATLIFGYDGKYVYDSNILDIEPSELEVQLTNELQNAFNLSVNVNYPTPQNIETLLKKAYVESINLAVNSNVYSEISMEQLVALALKEAHALSDKIKQ